MDCKVAIITGSVGGLGRAIAEALLSRGLKVCLTDVLADVGGAAADELTVQHGPGRVMYTNCDVTKREQIEAAWAECKARLGKPDLFVNNAGIYDEINWQKMVDINLIGCIFGTRLAIEKMSKATGGSGGTVINIASIAGVTINPFGPAYSATKYGVVGFTRALGHNVHLAITGVKVKCLCPNVIDTPLALDLVNRPFSPKLGEITEETLVGWKTLTPANVATALCQLVEEGPNGSAMVVDLNKEPYYVEASMVSKP